MPRSIVILLLLCLVLWPPMIRPLPAEASTATFTVNSVLDAHDATPGDGLCASVTNGCTLRAAVEEANAQPPGSAITIVLPVATYPLTLGTLVVTQNTLTLVGGGAGTTIVDGQSSRVLAVRAAALVTLDALTLRGGNAGGSAGGALVNLGATVLSQSTIAGNTATHGGGIYNGPSAHLLLLNSVVVSNTAPLGAGGGILNEGNLAVSGSSLRGNTALVGGAIASTGVLTVSASSLMANVSTLPCCTATYGGGAIYTRGLAAISNSTLGNNAANGYGGGLFNDKGGTATLTSSTLTGNATPHGNSILDSNSGGGIYNAGALTLTAGSLIGNSSAFGGGLFNAGTVTLTSSLVLSNTTYNGNVTFHNDGGGGIENTGTLTLTTSTVSGNAATDGGGTYNAGTLTLSASTFSRNVGSWGGGVKNIGTLTSTNSTVSGNTATNGGGIENAGTLTLRSDTVSGNTATNGGGIYNVGAVTLAGTVVANNTPAPNCFGAILETSGYNLDSDGSCALRQPTDLSATNPRLGPLASNGGPTQTMALLPGSPAIDHGGTSATGCPATDQPGVARPDEAGDSGACDIGAYESQHLN